MNTRFWKIVSCICVLMIALNGVFITGIKTVKAENTPIIYLNPTGHWVYGFNWPADTLISMTVGDYVVSGKTGIIPWMPDPNAVNFNFPSDIDLSPGVIIQMTDGVTTKNLTITNTTITNVDPENYLLSGTASPGSNVTIILEEPINQQFQIVAQPDGVWNLQLDPASNMLVPRLNIVAVEPDSEGNVTRMDWKIPAPIITVNPVWNSVSVNSMPLGSEITLSIEENGAVVFTSGPTPIIQGNYPDGLGVDFVLNGFDVKAGQVLTASGGGVSSSYSVTNFAITNLDVETDTIAGVATPGSQLQICVNLSGHCAFRYLVAGQDGTWSADFTTPGSRGDEQDLADITWGFNGWGNEKDQYGNQTWVAWNLPNPRFEVRGNIDQVRGWDWEQGKTVTMEVGGHTFTQTVGPATWDPNTSYVEFNIGQTHDIVPGDVVSLSDGTITKTTTVTSLALTGIDAAADTVSGVAEPGSLVDLWVCDPNNCSDIFRHVTADANGNWIAYYSKSGSQGDEQNTFDIVGGTWVDSQQVDEESDSTMYGQNVPNPRFDVRANADQVEAYEWALGDQLTVSVNGYRDTKPVEGMAPGDPNTTYVTFDLAGKVDIKAGDTVSVSNGMLTKTIVVTDLAIAGFDFSKDTIRGQAKPGLIVDTWACGQEGCFNRHVMPDVQGKWTADFAHPGPQDDEQNTVDLVNGTWVDSQQTDGDGDRTMFGLNLPNYRLDVRSQYDQVQAWEWGEGDKITVSVNGRAIQGAMVANSTRDDGLTYQEFNLAGQVDIKPGDTVSVSNGDLTKSTVVTGLKFTDIDNASDFVTGTAAPGSSFSIWACGSEGCFDRNVTADGSGNWQADFSQPGENGQSPVDLTYNVWVDSRQSDDDSDGTMYGVNIPWPIHHIFTYNTKTKISTQVTKNPNFIEENPNWAPAGKKFVHDVFTHDGTQYIAVTDLIAHTTVPLKGGEGGDDPVWSPNGLWIAYNSMYTNTTNIYIIPFKGGRKTLVHENGTSPAWSPNGQRLVFVDLGDGDKVKTISYLGRQEITVAERGYNPAWSPDGRWIAYELDQAIWKVRVDSLGRPIAKPVQLTFLDGWESQPAWSTDSATIIFQHGEVYDNFSATFDIWKIPSSGGHPSLFFGRPGFGDFDPDYLDNSFIAYCGMVEQPTQPMIIR